MSIPKRSTIKTPTEDMVDVNTAYMRSIMRSRNVNQSELSRAMGYCPEYLSNSIKDGRMQKSLLEALASILEFAYKEATKKRKHK